VTISPQLQLAAEWHANDVLNNRELDADIGSDGSMAQDRANAARVQRRRRRNRCDQPGAGDQRHRDHETSGNYRPDYMAIMSNCANSKMGVGR